MVMFNYNEIEKHIGYKFKNNKILLRAFTHSSFSSECNERLEFLGDSVLQIIVSDYLFHESSFNEGVLSKYRAKIVCEDNLFNAINLLNLQKYLIVGDSFKSAPTKAMCADLCESILGAMYIDSGCLQPCKEFIFNHIDLHLGLIEDSKSMLQEMVQGSGLTCNDITYETVQVNEKNGSFTFSSKVKISGKIYGEGKGRTKKQAEQCSAKKAIEKYKLGENLWFLKK